MGLASNSPRRVESGQGLRLVHERGGRGNSQQSPQMDPKTKAGDKGFILSVYCKLEMLFFFVFVIVLAFFHSAV